MKLLFMILSLLIATVAAGKPADFAQGRVVDPSDDSFVQRITLPEDVYTWVTRADLGDLRVFNGANEEVPYNIRRPQTREEFSPWQTLPLFPLPEPGVGRSPDARVRVEVDAGGAIVSISGDAAAGIASAAFLVDASERRQAPQQMRFAWDGQDAEDFVGRLRIEGSDDLEQWRELVGATTIARLSRDGHDVQLDQVELPANRQRYLRVTQLEGNDRIRLTSVEVRHFESRPIKRQWRQVSGIVVKQGHEFTTGGFFPIDRVTLEHPDPTVSFLVTARMFSRPVPEGPWRNRGERTFYRTIIGGIEVASEPLAMGDGDSYWRVEFEGEGLGDPQLKVGWRPDEVVFLKQGPAPYVLAYGQAGVDGRQWPLNQLLRQLGNGEPEDLTDVIAARLGESQTLGGPDRLQPPPIPVDWQTVLLWAVLVLGVVVVGGFAYRLLKN